MKMKLEDCSGESFHGHIGFFLSASHFCNYTDSDGCLAGTWPFPITNVLSHRQEATHPNAASMGEKLFGLRTKQNTVSSFSYMFCFPLQQCKTVR